MDVDPSIFLALASGAVLVWTLWSFNSGRRVARWGRRKLRRLLLVILIVGAAAIALTHG